MQTIDYCDAMAAVTRALSQGGVFLTAQASGAPNTMTIGWAQMGYIWRKPLFMAMVRPQRYTYGLIESSGEFTVSVPEPGECGALLSYAGSHCGAAEDKFVGHGLTAAPSMHTRAPVVAQCALHIECRVCAKQDLTPSGMDEALWAKWYPQNDPHRLYFGEILACYRT